MSIELTVWADHHHELRTDTAPVLISVLRATAIVQIGEKTTFDALIDTGAYLSVFSQLLWSEFADQIEWLTDETESDLPFWLKTAKGLTGGMIPCQIGRMTAVVYDPSMRRCTPEFPMIGMMLRDELRLTRRAVLGLYGHPLDFGFQWSGGGNPRAWLDQIE